MHEAHPPRPLQWSNGASQGARLPRFTPHRLYVSIPAAMRLDKTRNVPSWQRLWNPCAWDKSCTIRSS